MAEYVLLKEDGRVRFVTVPPKEEAKAIGAEYVEYYTRHISGKRYGILCDEDGITNNRPITAVYEDGRIAFVGDLLIGRIDKAGEFGALRAGDLFNIGQSIVTHQINHAFRTFVILDVIQ